MNELLAKLRTIKDEQALLDCLQALMVNFPENELVGDALLDCILILDDKLNN